MTPYVDHLIPYSWPLAIGCIIAAPTMAFILSATWWTLFRRVMDQDKWWALPFAFTWSMTMLAVMMLVGAVLVVGMAQPHALMPPMFWRS